jgi:hypothetical protein
VAVEKNHDFLIFVGGAGLDVRGGAGSGSGGVVVVPIDRGEQGGSNGTSCNVAVAVLAEIW